MHGEISHSLQTKFALGQSKTRKMRKFFCKNQNFSTFCDNFSQPATTLFVARQVGTWVVKRASSLFKSFCSDIRFCSPFYFQNNMSDIKYYENTKKKLHSRTRQTRSKYTSLQPVVCGRFSIHAFISGTFNTRVQCPANSGNLSSSLGTSVLPPKRMLFKKSKMEMSAQFSCRKETEKRKLNNTASYVVEAWDWPKLLAKVLVKRRIK